MLKVLWHVGKRKCNNADYYIMSQIILKYDDTSKEIKKNQNEDSQKESY